PTTRGRRMDASLRVLRGLLAGETVDGDDEFFPVRGALIRPVPEPPVPILIGGRSDAAIRRAGRLGDGWYGIWGSPGRYGQAVDQMQAVAADAGRSGVEWHNALNVWCGVGADADEARPFVATAMQAFYQLPYERFERWSPAGSPAQVADFLQPYVDAGCTTFNVIACGASLEAEVAAVGEIRARLCG